MDYQNDKFGRVVSMTNDGVNDKYTVTDSFATVTEFDFPAGTPLDQVYNSINSEAPSWYTPPVVPLNQQYTAQQFGLLILQQFNQKNADAGFTPDQLLPVLTSLVPFSMLLWTGAIQTFKCMIPSIPVDGTVITDARITAITAQVNSYLSGT